MAAITILTPTYNRGNMLGKLYDSLLQQTNKDFIWLIVDDGSTDDTELLAAKWKQAGEIEIIYEKQENGGKHRALNRGIGRIESPLTFIVDSDDYLPADSIGIILDYHQRFSHTPDICGYSFLRFYSNGEVNTAYFPKDEEIGTYLQVRINGGIGGDKAEVFFTKALKEYPFPEFPGEKFMPEDVVWMQMSEAYKMVHINRCIYISDYLEGGLTKSGRRMKLRSPQGMVLRSRIYLNHQDVKYKVKIKMMLLYHIYGKAADISVGKLMKEVKHKGLFMLCLLPGRILYQRWTSAADA